MRMNYLFANSRVSSCSCLDLHWTHSSTHQSKQRVAHLFHFGEQTFKLPVRIYSKKPLLSIRMFQFRWEYMVMLSQAGWFALDEL